MMSKIKPGKKFMAPKVNRALGARDSNPWTSAWSRRETGTGASPAPAPAPVVVEDVSLSQKQSLFFDLLSRGESVFITGAAGTGKSHVIKVLKDVMTRLNKTEKIFITASTGVAACNIGGLTIHSWAGIGTGAESLEELFARVNRSREAKRNWKKAEILVIDEISVMSSELFDKLSRVGGRMRGSDLPFGGLQLVVCGDFFQLPPVGLNDRNNRFCFESDIWKKLFSNDNIIILDQVFRQRETSFLSILHEMRRGEVSSASRARLEAKARAYRSQSQVPAAGSAPGSAAAELDSDIRATVLHSTNKDVDQINESELRKLRTDAVEFLATDEGPNTAQLKNLKAPPLLKLKVGAQVGRVLSGSLC
jgi:ATP-dependent DNA helicase PIF1